MYATVPIATAGQVRCAGSMAGGRIAWERGRPARWSCNCRRDACAPRGQLGEAKIQNLGLTASRDKHIRGLDVAMDDAFRVRGFERVRNLDGQIEQRIRFERLAFDPLPERLPFEQLHG